MIGLFAIIIGIILLLFSILSFIPAVGIITDPIWNLLTPTLETRELGRSDLMSALLVVGPLLSGGGFGLLKWSHGKIVGALSKKK